MFGIKYRVCLPLDISILSPSPVFRCGNYAQSVQYSVVILHSADHSDTGTLLGRISHCLYFRGYTGTAFMKKYSTIMDDLTTLG